jgi:radical SAM protein with 4Fe4S-binding SPASM domain
MVHVDGDVTTCCLDEHLENRIGNLKETPLSELWKGETMHRWRMAQIEGKFEESGPLCNQCNWQSAGSYPVEKVDAYLEKTGEMPRLRFRKKKTN